jgi:hypothetical protein
VFRSQDKSEAIVKQGQESGVIFGVSVGDFGFDFNPLPASTPPRDPVKKIESVLRRSMKAASFGACAEIGCVTKISAYVMPIVTIRKTIASVDPMIKISCACTSSGLRRRCGRWE